MHLCSGKNLGENRQGAPLNNTMLYANARATQRKRALGVANSQIRVLKRQAKQGRLEIIIS